MDLWLREEACKGADRRLLVEVYSRYAGDSHTQGISVAVPLVVVGIALAHKPPAAGYSLDQAEARSCLCLDSIVQVRTLFLQWIEHLVAG